MNKSRLYILAAAGIIAAAAGWRSPDAPGASSARNHEQRPMCRLSPCKQSRRKQAGCPLRLKTSSNIAAWRDISIASRTAGLRLAEVRVNVGDRVRKGRCWPMFAADTVRLKYCRRRPMCWPPKPRPPMHVPTPSAPAALPIPAPEPATDHIRWKLRPKPLRRPKAAAAQVQAARPSANPENTAGLCPCAGTDDGVISAKRHGGCSDCSRHGNVPAWCGRGGWNGVPKCQDRSCSRCRPGRRLCHQRWHGGIGARAQRLASLMIQSSALAWCTST